MKIVSKVAHVIINILLWFIVIIVAFFSIITFASKSAGGVANIFGYTPMTVLTDSMKPVFQANDLIIVQKTDTTELKVGDIISYWTAIEGKKSINTHRIVEVLESNGMYQYVTRGDANTSTDEFIVSAGDIIGSYRFAIPFLGYVLRFLSTSVGFLVIVVLPLLAFFIYQLYKFVLLLIELKKQTVMEATREAMAQLEKEKEEQQAKEEEENAELLK